MLSVSLLCLVITIGCFITPIGIYQQQHDKFLKLVSWSTEWETAARSLQRFERWQWPEMAGYYDVMLQ